MWFRIGLGTASLITVIVIVSNFGHSSKVLPTMNAPAALSIATPPSIALTDAEADAMLSAASSVVQSNVLASGAKCTLVLTRSGHVQTSANGVTNVDSNTAAQDLCAEPNGNGAYLHEVPVISYCGAIQVVQGCSIIGRPCMIVSSYDIPNSTVEAILWAHEFGHTKGLIHRSDPNALMNPTAAPGHTAVNGTECADMVSPGVSPNVAAGFQLQAQSGSESLKDFVHRSNVSGQLDVRTAKSYGLGASNELLSMLNSPDEKRSATTIIKLLGIIGDDDVVPPLTNYIRVGSGDITPSEYQAKIAAIISVGYLANSHYLQHKDGSDDGGPALQFLAAVVSPTSVDKLIGTWGLRGQNHLQRNQDVVRTGILALGVSGSPRAHEVLDSLTSRTGMFSLAPNEAELRDVIDLAKKENDQVRKEGLEEYYQKR